MIEVEDPGRHCDELVGVLEAAPSDATRRGVLMTGMAAQTTRGPTMYDVARLAGVSHQTVSRVINGTSGVRPAVRKRVQQAIAMLGYSRSAAAADLAGAQRHTVAVLGLGVDTACLEVYIGVHSEALRLQRQTIGSMIDPSDNDDLELALQAVLGRRPSAMVVVAPDASLHASVRRFAHRNEVRTLLVSAGPVPVDEQIGCVALKGVRDDEFRSHGARELGREALHEALRLEGGSNPREALLTLPPFVEADH